MSWFTIQNSEQIDSPALVLYQSRIEENIRLLVSMADDAKKLRPHVKTHKIKEICAMMIVAGIHKFKCATIAEAEMLALAGAKDVLLAYQPVGPKVLRYLTLMKKYPNTYFSCLVDNEVSVIELDKQANAAHNQIAIYIDLNVGMNRTGISSYAGALALWEKCTTLSSIEFKGLHAYDGHIHAKELEQRKNQSDECYLLVSKLRKEIELKAGKEINVVVGGTPTFPIHVQRERVECSPGTFVFWDEGYQASFNEQPFLTAALVMTRVVSQPTSTMLCLDMGHKSIAAEKELANRFKILNEGTFTIISQSEEHVVVETNENHGYKVGDVFYILPRHICPTVALYERALVVNEGRASLEWEIIARDRKIEC